MSNIALVDYGMGNLHSVGKALEKVGGRVTLVSDPDALKDASRIVLPGVGAFRDCMQTLNDTGLAEAVKARIDAGVPYLGICLGMQILMDASHEFGLFDGLGEISGTVRRFPETHPEHGFKIPHMGWNDVVLPSRQTPHPVLEALHGMQAYFVHSFYCAPEDPDQILAACSYGDFPFAAAVGRDNIVGVQFHPEKSQRAGLNLLEAFLTWQP